ncbi:MAG: hypothetical protein JRN66_08255 [Nitrososphaerota archaeon]|nr:hypothetical protein [Nitrososphaerota archaeon]
MESNNANQANLDISKSLDTIYKEIRVGKIYVDYTFSFWVEDGWDLLTKEDSKFYNNKYYFADLKDVMNFQADPSSFIDPSDNSSINDLNCLFHIDKPNLESFNKIIQNVRNTNKPLAWFERTVKWVINNKTNVVLVRRSDEREFPGEMKILGYVLASRKNDIYLGPYKNEVLRLIFKPLNGKFIYEEHLRPLGSSMTELDFRLIISFSILKSKSTKELSWKKNMVTFSLMFMFPNKETFAGKDLATLLEGAIKVSRIKLVNNNLFNPFIHKNEFETFDDLLVEIYTSVAKNNEKIDKPVNNDDDQVAKNNEKIDKPVNNDDDQLIKDKIKKTALIGLSLGPFSSNKSIIHIPDFRSKSITELKNNYSQIIPFLGRLAWSNRHNVFLNKIVNEKNDEEIIMDLREKQVSYWRADFISFINKYAKLLITTGNIDNDAFPMGSYIWVFANTVLAVENISLQLSMIHEYNDYIEKHISNPSVEETLKLRIQQVKDMEEYYNLQTSDSLFHDIIKALQKSFDIERGFDIIKSKIQETSSVNIFNEQSYTSKSLRLLNRFLIPLTFIAFLANFLSLTYDIDYFRNALLIFAIGMTTVVLGFAIVILSLIYTRNSMEKEGMK